MTVKQCAVLFVNAPRKPTPQADFLRASGFVVQAVHEWPGDPGRVRDYHVVVVTVRDIQEAPMVAARLRAKPHADRRLLVALVDPSTPPDRRRVAQSAGFDDVLDVTCEGRLLAARILRRLRTRPELRCALPHPGDRAA